MLTTVVRISSYFYWYFRPVLKWFLRKTTRLCELQRICYGEESGFSRSEKIENCLALSRTKELVDVIKQLNDLVNQGRFKDERTIKNCMDCTVNVTIHVKNIKPRSHMQFVTGFQKCLHQIYGYKQLIYDIEVLRKTPYSCEEEEHEKKLLQLWSLLNPKKPLQSRISKDWTDIGFQGDDPKTDFRGMGILGLDNLLYFASEHSEAARHVLLHSTHPSYGYSFAIVGINLTSMAYHLLKNGNLKTHFYNSVPSRPNIKHFNDVYCYLFYEFDKFWLAEKPRDIMEFNRIRSKFEGKIKQELENPKTVLKPKFIVKTL